MYLIKAGLGLDDKVAIFFLFDQFETEGGGLASSCWHWFLCC